MKIKVSQRRINSVLSVVISTFDWDNVELNTIVHYGDPIIDIGGRIPLIGCKSSQVPPPSISSIDESVKKFILKLKSTSPTDVSNGSGIAEWILDLRDIANGVSTSDEYDEDSNDCFFEEESENKRIHADFPLLKQFIGDDAELRAKSWSDEIVRRLTVAVRGLRCFSKLVVKEEVYEV